jgi:hypothetical protein
VQEVAYKGLHADVDSGGLPAQQGSCSRLPARAGEPQQAEMQGQRGAATLQASLEATAAQRDAAYGLLAESQSQLVAAKHEVAGLQASLEATARHRDEAGALLADLRLQREAVKLDAPLSRRRTALQVKDAWQQVAAERAPPAAPQAGGDGAQLPDSPGAAERQLVASCAQLSKMDVRVEAATLDAPLLQRNSRLQLDSVCMQLVAGTAALSALVKDAAAGHQELQAAWEGLMDDLRCGSRYRGYA